jgi:hypothetical protein
MRCICYSHSFVAPFCLHCWDIEHKVCSINPRTSAGIHCATVLACCIASPTHLQQFHVSGASMHNDHLCLPKEFVSHRHEMCHIQKNLVLWFLAVAYHINIQYGLRLYIFWYIHCIFVQTIHQWHTEVRAVECRKRKGKKNGCFWTMDVEKNFTSSLDREENKTLSFPYRASSISYNKCFQHMQLVLYLYFIYLLSPYMFRAFFGP